MVAAVAAVGLGSAPVWAGDELATVNGRAITKEAFQSAMEGCSGANDFGKNCKWFWKKPFLTRPQDVVV
jgi:hypothetical protein